MKLQKLMMVKTVQRKCEKIISVIGQVKENRLTELSISFDDDEGLIMVNMENPTVDKVGWFLTIDPQLVTLEIV